MKIGIITNFPSHTGAGKYAFELFRNMNKKYVDLLFCNYDNVKLNELKERNIKRINGIKLPFFKETINWYFYYPKKIPKGYNLYHITNQFLSRICEFRKPSVLTILDLVVLKSNKYVPFLTKYLQKKALKNINNINKIIAISEDTKKDLINFLNVEENKIKVIYMGVDHKIFKFREKLKCRKKLNLPTDKKIILHIGSDEPRRNINSILKSFYEIQKNHKDCMLVKIGRLSDKSKTIINKLNLNNKVLVFERVPEQMLPFYYSSSDIFLCLDIETGFGMPTLEAMSCGTSIVCSKGGAFPEIVGKTSLLVNPIDINEVVSSLNKLLLDENLRNKFSRIGLKQSKRFSWIKTAEETTKVYKEIL